MQINCTQCGAQIEAGEGELFLTCPYCSSAVYIDKSRVVFHYVVTATLGKDDATKALKRWMAGNDTVKGLEEKAEISSDELSYFPVWYFKVRKDGDEQVLTQLAASTPIIDLKTMRIPAGALRFYEPGDFEGQTLREPEMLYEAALAWIQKAGFSKENVLEAALVHVPVFQFRYEYEGMAYQALVEGSSGKVHSSVYPSKAETPFYAVAALAFMLFLIEGLLIGQFAVKLIAYLATSLPLIALAVLISERV